MVYGCLNESLYKRHEDWKYHQSTTDTECCNNIIF